MPQRTRSTSGGFPSTSPPTTAGSSSVADGEGSSQAHRVVVIEFPSMDKLLAFYDSADYATLKSLRMHSSDSRIIAVE